MRAGGPSTVLAAITATLLAGCGGSASSSSSSSTSSAAAPPPVHLTHSLQLQSSAFTANGPIPARYTCDGQDVPLPIRWSGVPAGTRELVLVMRDPDAPGGSFVHWALADIPPSATETISGTARGAVEGRNSFGSLGYRGPCPPAGAPAHHYVLSLSALTAHSGLKRGFNPDQLHAPAMAIATLIGTYGRR